ncbi:hypothetical protein R0V13_01470 [Facklamia hominis]|uniref:hypothetical protein n=1 Tax=Facklamia hominis TaxID=178214 RepID=UPI0029D41D2F|nr:hypothetical protein [Facklamia hominis]WPJ91087.1 hypothetical protein R0V13_01470 [Facklamia hominis]
MKNLGKFEHDDDVATLRNMETVVTLPQSGSSDPVIKLTFDQEITGATLKVRLFGQNGDRDDRGFREYYVYLNTGTKGNILKVFEVGEDPFMRFCYLGEITIDGKVVSIHISKTSTSDLIVTFEKLGHFGANILSAEITK